MQLINGRTVEQWRAYDRWKLMVAVVLALLLLLLWLMGMGPGRAAACCALPGAEAAAVAPPPAAVPATPSPTTPRPDVAPPEAEAVPTPPAPDCPTTIEAEVLFASSSATLTTGGRVELARLVPCLAEGRFEVAGHTDSSANDAINVPLAEARAQAVVDYLVAEGVDADRLTARGYGSSRPLVDNATPEGRAQNRRVEIHER